jgi:uncharacterized protein with PIN domain
MTRLFLDENVPEAVAVALRLRGYDVGTTRQTGRRGLTDGQQLDYAHSQGRILFTHNVADFAKIHVEYVRKGREHSGIILARQLPIGFIVTALLKFLSSSKAKDVRNQVVWLSDWLK